MPKYKGVSITKIGTTHIECQDRSSVFRSKNALGKTDSRYIAAVISDGHGSPKYFRSAKGAFYAIRALRESMDAVFGCERVVFTDNNMVELIDKIVEKWRIQVADDIKLHKLESSKKFHTLDKKEDRDDLVMYPEKAYGANFMAAIMTGSQLAVLKLGDCDGFVRYKDGKVCSLGEIDNRFDNDDERMGATDSLCGSNPQARFLHLIMSNADVDGVWLCSDGIYDSYLGQVYYVKRLVDASLDSFKKGQFIPAMKELGNHMQGYISQNGSGDDVSIAMLYLQ